MFPKISMVMVVLNRRESFEKALLSVISQQYPHTEIIVIDGGSTDGTVEVIKKYAQHISYWHSRPDGNATVAINLGIAKATGDLIALLHSDDWHEPGVLFAIAHAFSHQPTADMVTCCGRMVRFNPSKKTYDTLSAFTTKRALSLSFYNIFFGEPAICFRFMTRQLLNTIGPFLEKTAAGKSYYSNDKEWLMRVVLYNAKDVFVPILGYNYLAHPGSLTFSGHYDSLIRLFREHLEIAQLYLPTKMLSFKNRCLLRYWYNDQSARLAAYLFLDKQYKISLQTIVASIKQHPLLFPLSLMVTIMRVCTKKIVYGIRGLSTK